MTGVVQKRIWFKITNIYYGILHYLKLFKSNKIDVPKIKPIYKIL
jgi:hypothetical protein